MKDIQTSYKGVIMKEKFESAKKFVKNHKTDFICGGIVLGCIATIALIQASAELVSDDDDSADVNDTNVNEITED